MIGRIQLLQLMVVVTIMCLMLLREMTATHGMKSILVLMIRQGQHSHTAILSIVPLLQRWIYTTFLRIMMIKVHSSVILIECKLV